MNGWIALHRKLLDSPISDKPAYLALWVHLLLMANHADTHFIWNNRKHTLKEGQLLTGLKKLSKKTGIAQGTVYRILNYLENEKQIEQQKTTKYTVITIVNWNRYQQGEKQNGKQIENRLKTNEKQIETYNNNNNVNNDNNVNNNTGRKNSPKLEDIKAYCVERKSSVDAEKFFDYYTSNGWRVGKNPMKDWKAAVRTWERSSFTSKSPVKRFEAEDHSNAEAYFNNN